MVVDQRVPANHAEAMTPCIAGYEDPLLLLAVMREESNFKNNERSSAGACSYFQLLGGRYGKPSCRVLEADPALACREAVKELDYWKHHCGEAMLDAWNAGWRRCWTNPARKRCSTKCKNYSARVNKHLQWILTVWRIF